jgi:hypothetical protein
MIRIGVVLLVGLMMLWPRLLVAQSVDRPSEEIQVGDAWVYESKDGITGLLLQTYTSLVAEVSPTEIVTNAIFKGNNNRALIVFDHDWNRLVTNNQKFNPNDGHGVRWPLAVGKEWRSSYTTSNTQTGANTKVSSLAKVVAQETVTTPAGTFETFKIDRQLKEYSIADPSRYRDMQVIMWFSPQINHWVRRTSVVKQEKRTISNTSDELVQIIKKQ